MLDTSQSKPGRAVLATAHTSPASEAILTPAALDFLGRLHQRFDARRRELLCARAERQIRFDAGERPEFLVETRHVRASDWKVAAPPDELRDRRVEITGPVDRKMVINALNSGANVFMADFEDSSSPTTENMLAGQVNLRDAVRRDIAFEDPTNGKRYELCEAPAVLFVRPRGLHLEEHSLTCEGTPLAGALFDLGLFAFHNAAVLRDRNAGGAYFYLPKLESHLEARWWNEVLRWIESTLSLPSAFLRPTVLIETLPAAFEMDEILFELRERSLGLNCGRWDYIFSFLKVHRNDPSASLPDRATLGMDRRFLASYSALLVKTCHRRGAFAMGGMAAQIPIKSDPIANELALAKVRADKQREARAGHDGTWVAHPALVPTARAEFDAVMDGLNQLHVMREDVEVDAEDLLALPEGQRTDAGLRHNLRVGLLYLEAWLRGTGCVPIDHLMEDAATAEISRTQAWHWCKHRAQLEDGRMVTPALVRIVLTEVAGELRRELGPRRYDSGRFGDSVALFESLLLASDLAPFLTSAAQPLL